MGGSRSFDVCGYVREMKETADKFALYVGCDSQNYRSYTVYATTVVFRYPSAGAHVIYRKEKVPRIEDMWVAARREPQVCSTEGWSSGTLLVPPSEGIEF